MKLNLTVMLNTEAAPLWRWTIEVGKNCGKRLSAKEYEAVARAAEKEIERQIGKVKEPEPATPVSPKEAVEEKETVTAKTKWFRK